MKNNKIVMHRRTALKNLGILTGGIVLLPACDFSKEKVALVLNKFEVTEAQEKLLKEIVATILPDSEIPGAAELGADQFVWVMADDCLNENMRQDFLKGLREFPDKVKKATSNSFATLNMEERIAFLQKGLENSSAENKFLQTFLQITKNFAVSGFMQSEYIMTNVMPYPLVPGKYGNCEPIDANKIININA